jgi:hypothetical protein
MLRKNISTKYYSFQSHDLLPGGRWQPPGIPSTLYEDGSRMPFIRIHVKMAASWPPTCTLMTASWPPICMTVSDRVADVVMLSM